LKKQFLEATEKMEEGDGNDDDDDDEGDTGLLKLRTKSKQEQQEEEKEDEAFWQEEEKRTGNKGQGSGDDVLSSFWLSSELDENEKFLRKFRSLLFGSSLLFYPPLLEVMVT